MKTALLAVVAALAFAACSTDPDTICFDDDIGASDVYGAGLYADHRAEFEQKTGCKSLLNCSARITIHRCVDNVEFK